MWKYPVGSLQNGFKAKGFREISAAYIHTQISDRGSRIFLLSRLEARSLVPLNSAKDS